MGIANRYNANGKLWNVDNSQFSFIKLKELVENRSYPVFGCFISPDNGFGEGAVLITAEYNVNCPSRYCVLFRQMMADPEAVKQINDGKLYFHYEKFYSEKYKQDGYTIVFEDR